MKKTIKLILAISFLFPKHLLCAANTENPEIFDPITSRAQLMQFVQANPMPSDSETNTITRLRFDCSLTEVTQFIREPLSSRFPSLTASKTCEDLSTLVSVLDEIFTRKLEAGSSLSGIDSLREKRNYLSEKSSALGLDPIRKLLHTLSNEFVAAIRIVEERTRRTILTQTNGILSRKVSRKDNAGHLCFLKDPKNNEVPFFINNLLHSQQVPSIHYNFFGDFTPGLGSRGLIFNDKKTLLTQPGVFVMHYDRNNFGVYSYSGLPAYNCEGINWFIPCNNHKELSFKFGVPQNLPPYLSNSSGCFFPFSDTDQVHAVISKLMDIAIYTAERNSEASYIFFELIDLISSALSNNLSNPEPYSKPPKLTKSQRTRARKNLKKEAEIRSKESKKEETISGTSLSQGTDQVSDLTAPRPESELTDEKDIKQLDVDDCTKEETLPISLSASKTEHTSEEVEAPQSTVIQQVLATIPPGRTKQRVMNRLIKEWLKITGVPLEQIKIFVDGAHTKLHLEKSGKTVGNRHGRGKDNTYAHYEVIQEAKELVDAAMASKQSDKK